MVKEHRYQIQVEWTGKDGDGTRSYRAYRRDHILFAAGKAVIEASSDPAFLGDPARYNPEELLLASLSSCHMLWYLHLCSAAGVTVIEYFERAFGVMEESADGSGVFTSAQLHPKVRISDLRDSKKALSLHESAHQMCFIARSVNFPVSVAPELLTGPDSYTRTKQVAPAASKFGNSVP